MTRNAALLERAEVFYDTNVGGKLAGYVEGNDRVERAWRTIESWVRPTPRRVLEIGCAIGDICWRMSRVWPEADIVGLDVSGKSVEIATRLFEDPRITFVQGTVTATSLTGVFDTIVMLDVYEHIPRSDRPEVHQSLKRLLSDDGQVVMSFPTPQHLAWLRQSQPEEIQPVDEDVTPEVILALAEDTTTDVVLYQKVDVWHEGDYAHAVLRRQTWVPGGRPRPRPREGLTRQLQRYLSRGRPDRLRAERLKRVHERMGPDSYPGK